MLVILDGRLTLVDAAGNDVAWCDGGLWFKQQDEGAEQLASFEALRMIEEVYLAKQTETT